MIKDFLKKPESFFLFTALILGLLYIALTAPLQVPDEVNHFYRAYQISEGHFTATRTSNKLGGNLPEGLAEFSANWERLIGKADVQTSYDEIAESARIQIGNRRQWYDFPNTAIYSMVNYLPQSIGISISRLFTSSVLSIYYGSRITSLFLWILIVFVSIKLMPGKQWLMAAVALLPMSLYVNSSLSADLMVNGLSFLFISLIFRFRSQTKRLSPLQLLILGAFALSLPLLKLVYLPLLLLVVLIPKRNLGSTGGQYLFYAIMFIVAVLSTLWTNHSVNELYIPYAEYAKDAGWVHLAEGSNKAEQLQYVLDHPFDFITVVLRSMTNGYDMYLRGYIGTFGWLEFGLPTLVVFITYVLLMLSSSSDNFLKISGLHRSWIALVALLMVIMIILSQYVIWGVVGSDLVTNLQGRYFIPVFILLFLIIPSKPKPKIASIISVGLILLINSISLFLIFQRFFLQ